MALGQVIGGAPGRILNVAFSEFLKREEKNVFRKRKLLSMLQKMGNVTYNGTGPRFEWIIKYKRVPLVPGGIGQTFNFQARSRRKTAVLDWRSVAVTDAIHKMEKLMNRGQNSIIKLAAQMMRDLSEDIQDRFCEELFVDGNATGNGYRIHGLESWFSNSGADSDGYIGVANDTYAGLACTLGTYGGQWTGNWPDGTGDYEYDFWTPLIVDYTDTAWEASTKTWTNTATEAMRFGIINTQRNNVDTGLILLEKNLYRQWLASMDDKERVQLSRQSSAKEVDLGFGDVQHLDGVKVTWEVGVPSGVGYGLDMENLEIRSMQGQLFVPADEDYDIESQTTRDLVDFYGNMRANPRNHFKLLAIT